LLAQRAEQMRMVVAVRGGPPRRDPVDEFAAVGEDDPRAVRRDDLERRRAIGE
jgi:hypothetical protein